MTFIELNMKKTKILPEADLNALSPYIYVKCDHGKSRTVVFFLMSTFSRLVPAFSIREILSTSDHMGGIIINLHIVSGDYYLKLDYEQSITNTFHHVEIDRFTLNSSLPSGISIRLDLSLISTEWMSLNIYGIEESLKGEMIELACKCFEKVKSPGIPDQSIEKF